LRFLIVGLTGTKGYTASLRIKSSKTTNKYDNTKNQNPAAKNQESISKIKNK